MLELFGSLDGDQRAPDLSQSDMEADTSLGSGLGVELRLVGDKRVWVSLPEEPGDFEVVGLSTGWAV